MKSQRVQITAKLILGLAACALLFQNCAAAGPPDVSQLIQSSTSVQPIPPAGSTTGPNPTPPPVTQTYSWSVGAWSACSGGSQTRTVDCVNSVGTMVANSNCKAGKPADRQSCSSVTYVCTATLTAASEFFPQGFCSYTCVGPATYHAFASDPAQCRPSPIGVPGTDTMYNADFTAQVARPFSNCTVKNNFRNTANGYQAESSCN